MFFKKLEKYLFQHLSMPDKITYYIYAKFKHMTDHDLDKILRDPLFMYLMSRAVTVCLKYQLPSESLHELLEGGDMDAFIQKQWNEDKSREEKQAILFGDLQALAAEYKANRDMYIEICKSQGRTFARKFLKASRAELTKQGWYDHIVNELKIYFENEK